MAVEHLNFNDVETHSRMPAIVRQVFIIINTERVYYSYSFSFERSEHSRIYNTMV